MKSILMCVGIVLLMADAAEAQTTQKTKSAKATHKENKQVEQQQNNTEKLQATGTYPAKETIVLSPKQIANAPINKTATAQQFQIADPVLRAIERSTIKGENSERVMEDIIGIRRATYGIANGHLTFLPGGARSSGATTGSGAVGTGTSPGVIGAGGHTMGLNGKSLYAGPGVYGNSLYGITTVDKTRIEALEQLKTKRVNTVRSAKTIKPSN